MSFTSEQHGGFGDVDGEDESDETGESGVHGFCLLRMSHGAVSIVTIFDLIFQMIQVNIIIQCVG